MLPVSFADVHSSIFSETGIVATAESKLFRHPASPTPGTGIPSRLISAESLCQSRALLKTHKALSALGTPGWCYRP